MTHYMKHSLLGTRRVILSIITRNFFVIRNKTTNDNRNQSNVYYNRRQLRQHHDNCRRLQENNKCTFSAKQYFGIYFWFFSITFFISDKRLPLFDFPFCNPNSDFLFFNLITVFLKGILPVNFSL